MTIKTKSTVRPQHKIALRITHFLKSLERELWAQSPTSYHYVTFLSQSGINPPYLLTRFLGVAMTWPYKFEVCWE